MKRSPETTIDRSREAITPERRRKMRAEELKRIYAEMERAPTRRKRALGATLVLSTMLAAGWWYFRHERNLDEEKEGDTMEEGGGERAVLEENGGKQAQKPRSREVNERLQRLMEEAGRQIAAAEPPDERPLISAEEILQARYDIISKAEADLWHRIAGKDIPIEADPFWEEMSIFLGGIDGTLAASSYFKNSGFDVFLPELVYREKIRDIQNAISEDNYRLAYNQLLFLLIRLGADRSDLAEVVESRATMEDVAM